MFVGSSAVFKKLTSLTESRACLSVAIFLSMKAKRSDILNSIEDCIVFYSTQWVSRKTTDTHIWMSIQRAYFDEFDYLSRLPSARPVTHKTFLTEMQNLLREQGAISSGRSGQMMEKNYLVFQSLRKKK